MFRGGVIVRYVFYQFWLWQLVTAGESSSDSRLSTFFSLPKLHYVADGAPCNSWERSAVSRPARLPAMLTTALLLPSSVPATDGTGLTQHIVHTVQRCRCRECCTDRTRSPRRMLTMQWRGRPYRVKHVPSWQSVWPCAVRYTQRACSAATLRGSESRACRVLLHLVR